MSNQIITKETLKTYFQTNDVPTQSQFDDLISTVTTVGSDTVVTLTDNTEYTLEVNDENGKGPAKTYVYNGTGVVTINLPSVDATNIGIWYNIINLTTYKVSVQAADSDAIDDSGPGATIYNGEDDLSSESSNSAQEVDQFASIKVQLCTPTWWHVLHGRKTWTTTEFV